MKVMTAGMKDAKGTSMLEDYTYNLVKGKEGILEAHMLEICPSIADGPISIKCQPLSMGEEKIRQDLYLHRRKDTELQLL